MLSSMGTPVRATPWARGLLAIWLLGVVVLAWRGASVASAGALLVALLGTVALGVFFAQLGLFARPIVRARTREATLALTFDDGPEPGTTRAVLDLLDAHGHRGTFFVIGRRADEAALREITSRGHAIANHSFAHSHATPFLAPAVLAADLERAEALLTSVRGTRGRWFRAPIGIVSPRVAQAAKLAGLELVSWTASAKDGTRHATVASGLRRLRGALQPGAILVLHDGAERSDRAPIAPALLEQLLIEMNARGLRSVTLDELLG
jgi:peptidoglycan/xylan/chitin deacetylase (PgdA/CDA1 family)